MEERSGGVGTLLDHGTSSLEPDFQHLIWPVSLTTDYLLNSGNCILITLLMFPYFLMGDNKNDSQSGQED